MSGRPSAADRAADTSRRRAAVKRPELHVVSPPPAGAPLPAGGQEDPGAPSTSRGAGVRPAIAWFEDKVRLDLVDIAEDRLRPVDPAWVATIAATYAHVGQLQKVMLVKERNGRFTCDGHGFGAHRILAARSAGWKAIDARFLHRQDVDAARDRLPEVIENLIRRENTALEEAHLLYEYRAAFERLYPPRGRGGDRRSKAARDQTESDSFWSIASEQSGLTRRSIEIKLAMWAGLSEASRTHLRGTPLASNQGALRAIAVLDERLQGKVLDLLLSDPPAAQNVPDAILLAQGKRLDTPAERKFNTVSGGLSRLDATARGTLFDFYADEIIERFRDRGLI